MGTLLRVGRVGEGNERDGGLTPDVIAGCGLGKCCGSGGGGGGNVIWAEVIY